MHFIVSSPNYRYYCVPPPTSRRIDSSSVGQQDTHPTATADASFDHDFNDPQQPNAQALAESTFPWQEWGDPDEDEELDAGLHHLLQHKDFLNLLPDDSTQPFAGAVLGQAQKRTHQIAFRDDPVDTNFLPYTIQHFPEYLPRIPSPKPHATEEMNDSFTNPFAPDDGNCTHPALQRIRNPLAPQTTIQIDGFIKATFHLKAPGSSRELVKLPLFPSRPHQQQLPQHQLPHQQTVDNMDQPRLFDSAQIPPLPPNFGDIKLKTLDRKLFEFSICRGRTVVPNDNLYLKQITPMADKSSLVKHIILAVAASYVLDWYFDPAIKFQANWHYNRAVNLLEEELKNPANWHAGKGEPLIASLILFSHNENVNWEVIGTNEHFPKWYRGASLAEKILDASDPATSYEHPVNVQFTKARDQLGNRVCLDSVFSHCVYPLDVNPGKCRHLWLNHGSHREKRRIIGFTGLSSELMHSFVKITHLSARRKRRPQSDIIPVVGNEIRINLENFWQWTELVPCGYSTSQELLDSCQLDENGKVTTESEVTMLIAESYVAAAQIYLQCRLFRRRRNDPLVQKLLLRQLRTIQWQPTEGRLFTAQTPLFAVFIAAMVAYKEEDRNIIRGWFEPICKGSRGNVPPIYESVKQIWNWLDEREEERDAAEIKANRTNKGKEVATRDQDPADDESDNLDYRMNENDGVALDNSDAWWEDLVGELKSGTGSPSLLGAQAMEDYAIEDVPLGTRRPIRVVCIGAGYSGLLMSIIVSQKLQNQNVDFQVYELNGDLGGTWLVNSFCPNPHWSSVYPKAPEIHQYLKDTSNKYGCDKYISYHRKLSSAFWHEATGEWRLKITNVVSGIEAEDWCHVLINASGALNNWKWPQIEGIHQFRGKIMHSAAWDESYDFAGKKVAVLGIGASGVQLLPQLAKIVEHATLFARSPTWIAPQAKPAPPDSTYQSSFIDSNMNYSAEVQRRFSDDPTYLQLHRRDLADRRIESFKLLNGGRSPQEKLSDTLRSSMLQQLGHSEKAKFIAEYLIPSFPVGCRRLTPGPGFLETLTRDNVDMVWGAIERITDNGIQPVDGSYHDFDAIVCTTGFECSYAPRFTLRGRNGVDLSEQWLSSDPEAYFGTTVAGFPNYFMFVGPNCPVSNGGLVQAIQAQGVYIYKCISKMQLEGIRSMEVSQAAMGDYNIHSQAYLRDSIWAADCRSWYKRNTKDGRVIAVYSGSTHHFVEMMRKPRWEDYVFDYVTYDELAGIPRSKPNRFAFLGNGFTKREAENKSIGRTQTLNFEEFWNLMEIPTIYEE
ncbi:hypothetical protein SCAR479_10280 [Seiridium cardinale]|uniref:Flavin-containing monooxygenase n=1 Tax=Seiridium cardinale TaxID=138064 RepID=A0ABR2XGJ2_9PEZI